MVSLKFCKARDRRRVVAFLLLLLISWDGGLIGSAQSVDGTCQSIPPLLSTCPSAPPPPAKLKIGVILDMSGASAAVSAAIWNGTKLAAAHLSCLLGSPSAVTLQLRDSGDTVDGAASATEAVLAVPELAALIGPTRSQQASAVVARAAAAGIPVVAVSHTSSYRGRNLGVTLSSGTTGSSGSGSNSDPRYPYLFLASLGLDQLLRAAVATLMSLNKITTVSVLYDSDSLASIVERDMYLAAFASLNITVLASRDILTGDTLRSSTQVEAVMSALVAASPGAIALLVLPVDLPLALTLKHRLKYSGVILGAGAMAEFIDSPAANGTGIAGMAPQVVPLLWHKDGVAKNTTRASSNTGSGNSTGSTGGVSGSISGSGAGSGNSTGMGTGADDVSDEAAMLDMFLESYYQAYKVAPDQWAAHGYAGVQVIASGIRCWGAAFAAANFGGDMAADIGNVTVYPMARRAREGMPMLYNVPTPLGAFGFVPLGSGGSTGLGGNITGGSSSNSTAGSGNGTSQGPYVYESQYAPAVMMRNLTGGGTTLINLLDNYVPPEVFKPKEFPLNCTVAGRAAVGGWTWDGCRVPPEWTDATVFKVAIMISLKGPVRVPMLAAVNGFDLALQHIHRSCYLGPARLQMVYYEAGDTNDAAVAVARQLVADPSVLAIMGPTYSSQAFATNPIAQAAGVVVLGYSNSATGVTGAGDYIFRDSIAGPKLIRSLAGTLVRINVSSVCIIYDVKQAFAVDDFASFSAALQAVGIPLHGVSTYITSDTIKFLNQVRTNLQQLLLLRPGGVVVLGAPSDSVAIVVQLRLMGFKGVIMGANGLVNDATLAEPYAEGVLTEAAWHIKSSHPSSLFMADTYRSYYNQDASIWAAQAYSAPWLIAGALRCGRGAQSLNRTHLRDSLRANVVNFPIPLGNFSFDAERNPDFSTITQVNHNKTWQVFSVDAYLGTNGAAPPPPAAPNCTANASAPGCGATSAAALGRRFFIAGRAAWGTVAACLALAALLV